MALTLKHKFTSPKADGTDSTLVQPSNWNADHDISIGPNSIVGRWASTAGAAAEVIMSDNLDLTTNKLDLSKNVTFPGTGAMTVPVGTTTNRPTAPVNGMLRYNTTLKKFEKYENGAWGELWAIPSNVDISLTLTVGGAVTFNSVGQMKIPSGATSQRSTSPVAGMFRFNSTLSQFEGYDGDAWGAIGANIWPVGYLSGMGMVWATATTFTVTPGDCRNEDTAAPRNMSLGSNITKSLATWSGGSGVGSLDTGVIGASNTYHVFAIRKDIDGSTDVLLSLNPSGPVMPGGYTAYRRVGSIMTDASKQIVRFFQYGDEFVLYTPILDVSIQGTTITATATRTLSVPTGVRVKAKMIAGVWHPASTNSESLTIWCPDHPDQSSSTSMFTYGPPTAPIPVISSGGGNTWGFGAVEVFTNTAAQVKTKVMTAAASSGISIQTNGWTDTRGK